MIRDARTDQVLVILHSVISDRGVISAAEQLVAGDAQLRYLRVVPRLVPFTASFFREPHAAVSSGSPIRMVAASDDMARTILDVGREMKSTLLALGEPPQDTGRADLVRELLSRLLAASRTPLLYVPPGSKSPRERLRRILLVVHLPYPATELVNLSVPLARRTQAELMILALPWAAPIVSDHALGGKTGRSLAFPPFDAGAWTERECARHGCRARPVAFEGNMVEVILERAATLEADLVVAGRDLADVRVGWRRRKIQDLLFPRLPCPVLLGRSA